MSNLIVEGLRCHILEQYFLDLGLFEMSCTGLLLNNYFTNWFFFFISHLYKHTFNEMYCCFNVLLHTHVSQNFWLDAISVANPHLFSCKIENKKHYLNNSDTYLQWLWCQDQNKHTHTASFFSLCIKSIHKSLIDLGYKRHLAKMLWGGTESRIDWEANF